MGHPLHSIEQADFTCHLPGDKIVWKYLSDSVHCKLCIYLLESWKLNLVLFGVVLLFTLYFVDITSRWHQFSKERHISPWLPYALDIWAFKAKLMKLSSPLQPDFELLPWTPHQLHGLCSWYTFNTIDSHNLIPNSNGLWKICFSTMGDLI